MENLLLQQIRGELARANALKYFELRLKLTESTHPMVKEKLEFLTKQLDKEYHSVS